MSIGIFVEALGDRRHQQAFMQRFDDTLTLAARYNLFAELEQGTPAHCHPATQQQVKAFSEASDRGADLHEEWGGNAADCLGRVWTRVGRFHDSLERLEDWNSFLGCMSLLPEKQMKQIMRFLAR